MMSKEKVLDEQIELHIFIKDTRYKCEDNNEVKLFRDISEAQEYFQSQTEVFRQDAIDDGWVIDCDRDDCFEAYEEGYESQNHYYLRIETQKV